MWARKKVLCTECPKSTITAQSLSWVEQYALWKRLGGDVLSMNARTADAFVMLDQAWGEEADSETNKNQSIR